MERNTILKSFIESKRNAYDMGEDGNQSYVISNFAILNNLSEAKSKLVLHNYLFDKFLESGHIDFDSFIQKEMTYKEQESMTQIGSDIPQNVRPEQPIKDDKEEYDEKYSYLFEDDEDYEIEKDDTENEDKGNTRENDSDSLEIDSSENKDYSKLPPVVIEFLDNTHLSEANENEAKLFLSRFKEVLQEVIDNRYVVSLIILLLYKAKFEPENLSEGEKEELEDVVFHFNQNFNSDTEESDTIEESYKSLYEVDKKDLETAGKKLASKVGQGITQAASDVYKKYPIATSLVGASVLLGVGTLALTGWLVFSSFKKIKFDKLKDKLKDNIKNGNTKDIEQTLESEGITKDTKKSDIQEPVQENEIQKEVETFNNEIQETIDNQSQIKNELVTQTKEELSNAETKNKVDKELKKKRQYVKKNKQYWGKDQVSSDTSKDNKKDNKKDKAKPVDTKDKKDDKKKKPEVKSKVSDTKKKDDKKTDKKTSDTKKPIEKKDSKTMGSAKKKDTDTKKSDTKKPIKKDVTQKPSDTKKVDTKPKPNENIDAYKKRTGNKKLPKGYVTDPKTKRITKKKESYEVYKLLF